MKNSLLMTQNDLKELSDEFNSTDWSVFPLSEGSSTWIPILLILVVFFGFRYLAKTIERN
jgi:hypothetical protein